MLFRSFGLAKHLNTSDSNTQSGSVIGTPSYMSPEQAAGRTHEIGPAADVYALGAVLYEMLTGRPPFRAETPLETILMVVQGDPVPPTRLQPRVPRDLETICLKCLNKDPQRRYASAQALGEDLRRYLDGVPILARPLSAWGRAVKWVRRRPTAAALLGLSVVTALLLLVGGIWSYAALKRAADRVAAEADEARAAKRRAEDALQEGSERLVRLHVANATRELDAGNHLVALLSFAEALQLDQGTGREAMHRSRLELVRRHCPKLRQVWAHEGPLHDARFSPDGRRVVTDRKSTV